jgi:hypothetical protein
MFGTRDRIYGLHFHFTLSRYCSEFTEPFTALVRLEEFYSPGGKDFVFPVQPDSNPSNRYYVEAQLSYPLNNNHQVVIINILDCKDVPVAQTFLTYNWLYKQRMKFIEKKTLDHTGCMVTCQNLKCHLSLVRMGSNVACTSVCSPFWPPQIKDMETECSIIQCWVQQNTRPGTCLPISLVGIFPSPIFSYLALDNATDEKSFDMEGAVKYSQHRVCSLLQDARVSGRIVEKMESNPPTKLRDWICLMCGNRSIGRKHAMTKHGFLFPQLNLVNCSESDMVGNHMCFLHLLYASQHLSKRGVYRDISTFLNSDRVGTKFLSLMQTMWPCIFIMKTNPNSNPSCNPQQYKLLYGLAKKGVLNRLIFDNGSTIEVGDIVAMAPNPDHHTCEDEGLELNLISWRDYKNAFISTCLLQGKRDFDHYKFEPIHGLGVSMTHRESGIYGNGLHQIYSTSHIRPHSVVCKSLETSIQLNSSKMMRPLLKSSTALYEIAEGTISSINGFENSLSQKIPWQAGWITNASNMWEADHQVTAFDTWQCIFVNYRKGREIIEDDYSTTL